MSNVDKDLDYMISPQEFYTLLSQKFEKDDPKEETRRRTDAYDFAVDFFWELNQIQTCMDSLDFEAKCPVTVSKLSSSL